jgi:hypothetical protein
MFTVRVVRESSIVSKSWEGRDDDGDVMSQDEDEWQFLYVFLGWKVSFRLLSHKKWDKQLLQQYLQQPRGSMLDPFFDYLDHSSHS